VSNLFQPNQIAVFLENYNFYFMETSLRSSVCRSMENEKIYGYLNG